MLRNTGAARLISEPGAAARIAVSSVPPSTATSHWDSASINISSLSEDSGAPDATAWQSSPMRSMIASTALTVAGSGIRRSEEHTSELQSLMRISYAVFCLKNKQHTDETTITHISKASYINNETH